MPKILHLADLHLDSPFRGHSPAESEKRRLAMRQTFASLIAYIRTNRIPLALIAGDLFDAVVTGETAAFVIEQIALAADCHFVIAPGNHDPMRAGSVYETMRFPENVTVFSHASLERVSLPALGVTVYGYAFTDRSLTPSPLLGQRAEEDDTLHLLCAHAEIGAPLSPYAPITEADIEALGMDYCAFGHVHTYSGLKRVGKTYYAYSGCFEGRDFGELGEKGAVLLDIEKENGSLRVSAEWLRFSRYRYESASVDLSGVTENAEAAERIRTCLKQGSYGEDTLLRLRLQGSVSPSLSLDIAAWRQTFAASVFYLEIEDATLPLYDVAALEKDVGIRGAFFAEMRPLLEAGTPEERVEAARALRVGLAALHGEDFTAIE